jgi:Parvulin-like peptidyl-prolyl isomerase
MLQTIRERVSGWIAWFIVILIAIPFALWGINTYFVGNAQQYAARVNDTDIPLHTFQQVYQARRQQLQSIFGSNFSPALINDAQLKHEVLNTLITQELLAQSVFAAGFRVGEAQLAEKIRKIEAFQRDGNFSQDLYEQQVLSQGMVPAAFEAYLMRLLTMGQLESGIRDTALVTDQEVNQRIVLDQQERSLSYLRLPVERFLTEVTVADSEITQYYETHQALYTNPARVQVEYLELNLDDIAASITPSEEDLRSLYEEQGEGLLEEEQRKASHILIEVPADADQAQVDKAQTQLNELRERIRAGESFASLAKEYSQDIETAEKGGDLGYFGRGMKVKPFEEAVFALERGAISEPVRTPFGVHLIRLDDIRPARKQTFEEARAELERQFRQRQAETRLYDQSERLADLTFGKPDTLDPAAQALGLKVKVSEWFTRDSGAGIAQQDKVREIAFSEDVLVKGHNSELIELGSNRFVVLRVQTHQPSIQRPLDEVRDEIHEAKRLEQARNQARKAGEALLTRLKTGETTPGDLAKEAEVEVTQAGLVRRNDARHDAAILGAAFRLPRPLPDQPSFGSMVLPSGDYVVFIVSEVREGNPSEIADEERRTVQAALARAYGDQEFADLLASLRTHADIEIFTDNL